MVALDYEGWHHQLSSDRTDGANEVPQFRILLVEDDAKLVRALRRGLDAEGYQVEAVRDGNGGFMQAVTDQFDAVILDLMLPGLDGMQVCRQLRARDIRVPILMLTARADVSDRIRGLDEGADDYLVKPFDFQELLARIRVLLRRGPTQHGQALVVGALRMQPSTRAVTWQGRRVELTAREFDVLEVLARTPGQAVSRADLLAAVWYNEPQVSRNVVDVYIGYLRRKLELPAGGRLISTVRGKGFMLEPS